VARLQQIGRGGFVCVERAYNRGSEAAPGSRRLAHCHP